MSSVAVAAVKVAARNSDNVSSAYKAISRASTGVTDLASILRKIDVRSYAKAFGEAAPALKRSSKLVDTGKAVKKFARAVPPSTDELLVSINPSALLKNAKKSSAVAADASKKFDPSAMADLKSLNKLDDASSAISSTAKVDGLKGLSRRSESLLSNSRRYRALSRATPPVKKIDDVGDALRKSKGAASKVDDVADAGADIAKKSYKKIDDAVEGAGKLAKTKKALKLAKKWSTVVNVSVLGGFYMGMYISNKINASENDGGGDGSGLVSDPASDAFPVTKYEETELVVAVDDGEVTMMEIVQRKEVLFAAVAAMIIVATL